MKTFFEKIFDCEDHKFHFERLFQAMINPFYHQVGPVHGRIIDFAVCPRHTAIGYAVFSILEALKRLKAICRNKASRAFLINFGNLARYALLYKWLNPKYCSTIYRNLEIALLRSVSYSVSSLPVVALRFNAL